MGRYTLVSNNSKVPYFTKAYLEDIDRLTTTIDEDNKELMEDLQQLGIDDINHLVIYYNASKEKKILDTLDERYKFLNNMRVNEGKINVSDTTFKSKISEIINKLRINPSLYTSLLKSCSISDKAKECIINYLKDNKPFNYENLLYHLSQYIQFRKLVVFVDQFEELGYAPTSKIENDIIEELPIIR